MIYTKSIVLLGFLTDFIWYLECTYAATVDAWNECRPIPKEFIE